MSQASVIKDTPKENAKVLSNDKVCSFLSNYGIKLRILEYRTPFDKSCRPCVDNVLAGTLKSFLIGYGVGAGFNILKLLFNLKKVTKRPSMIIESLTSEGILRLGGFTGSMTFILKSIIAIMRILRQKDDGWNGALGGFLAGFISLFILKSYKKTFIACLLLTRSLECIYNHYADKKLFKRNSMHWMIIYALMNTFVARCFPYEPYLLDQGMLKFIDWVTSCQPSEQIFNSLTREQTRRRLITGFKNLRDPFLKN